MRVMFFLPAPLPLAGGAGGGRALSASATVESARPPPTPPASGRGEEGYFPVQVPARFSTKALIPSL
ncbi:hypothetical protein EAH76_17490 [Sphingomonas glacialis]|uniref:Uncharacterized protein n=1 Tax=Sphingomonas glacialis TaxID=658225 RepID=A0A502FJP7_9SPHN|nr:hypothetical protein EAH76_17490 [Sphingomonas glacialis]